MLYFLQNLQSSGGIDLSARDLIGSPFCLKVFILNAVPTDALHIGSLRGGAGYICTVGLEILSSCAKP